MPRVAAACAATLALSTAPALAHPPGACLSVAERCETWFATFDEPATMPSARSDQFTTTVLMNMTTVFIVVRSVAFPPASPEDATAAAVVVAYDRVSGAVRWTAREQSRRYFSPHDAALSPDGSRLYLASAAYSAWPIGAVDSRLVVSAYSTASGATLWSSSWDARPDAVDNPKGIAVSPDGRSVYVTGVTTSTGGDLDYVTLAYRASDGRELWSDVYAGPRALDAPFGIAVSPDGAVVAVTGWSDSDGAEFDADYATVAYSTRGRGGRRLWVARYDGVGAHRSDRGNAIAADASRVYVTGDSYGPTGYDYATVAYDLSSGGQVWESRWSGGRGGFNAATSVAAAGGRVVVTGQSSAVSPDDGNDTGTVAYDATSGARLWSASFGPARHDGWARGLALSPDGATAYVVTMETPLVPYTALSRLALVAYSTASGAVSWQTTLDPAFGDALAGSGVAADGGSVAVVGNYTRSANPLGPPEQNVYDVVTAAFSTPAADAG